MTDVNEERSEEFQALENTHKDVETHVERLKNLQKKGKLESHLSDEMSSTVLPLFSEMSQALLKWAQSAEDFMADLADEIEGGSEEGGAGSFSYEDLLVLRDAILLALQHLQLTEKAEDLPEELRKVVTDQKKNFEKMKTVLDKEIEDGESSSEESEASTAEEEDVSSISSQDSGRDANS